MKLLGRLALSAVLAVGAGHAQTNAPARRVAPLSAAAILAPNTSRGSAKAPITVLVFSDFESFPCARSASVIDGFLQQTRIPGKP